MAHYASFRTLCIWTYDAYMRHSAPKVLNTSIKEHMKIVQNYNLHNYDQIEKELCTSCQDLL